MTRIEAVQRPQTGYTVLERLSLVSELFSVDGKKESEYAN